MTIEECSQDFQALMDSDNTLVDDEQSDTHVRA